jgi:hypothetical protein
VTNGAKGRPVRPCPSASKKRPLELTEQRNLEEVRMMARRMRTAIVAGALGLAVLVGSGAAVAQDRPPRDPNPPGYHQGHHRDGWHGHGERHGYYDDQGNWHHGYYDDQGNWHHGYHDDEGNWHEQS